ncbi:MAG: dihydrolipoyl dehydrogenase family protein [Opitutales bacterium]
MEKTFDFVVIGGGTAGYSAASTAREWTDSVAVVDNSDELGGLCILRGCMPSKTLIYSAEVLHLAHHAKKFGLNIPEASADMAAVHRRKVHWIGDFKSGRQENLQSEKYALFRQKGRFISADRFELEDGTVLQSERFVVATGSVVNWPPVPGLREIEGVWTSDDVLDLDFLPESVIVLGGGVIACELAQFLNRMGSKITQIQRSPHVLTGTPTGMVEVIEKAFRDEGIELITGTDLKKVEKTADGFAVHYDCDGKSCKAEAKHLFNALGRRPNSAELGLEQAGVEVSKKGHIEKDAACQTSNPRIHTAGDVTGPQEIVHLAGMQGSISAKHAFGKNYTPINYDHVTRVVFTDPQLANVGLSDAEIESRGIEYLSASYPFDDHGKSLLMEAHYGFVKVSARKDTGQILGAECVGKDASELIHALSPAVACALTVFDMLKAHWYHPTLSEIWEYPLEEIAEQVSS